VLRCILGTKQENGTWRKRYNHELYEIFNGPNIVNYIIVKRLAWAGHVVRMNSDRTPKKNIPTPNQMEQEALEDRNCDGKMVLINI
jgi:hypothetical protein